MGPVKTTNRCRFLRPLFLSFFDVIRLFHPRPPFGQWILIFFTTFSLSSNILSAMQILSMSFEYFNSFPGGSSSRSYGYLHDQLPRSYHRQPPSPEDGSSNSPTGGGNYSPSSTDMKLNNADQFDMASLASRSYPDQTLILPGPSGRHFGESSMVGHVSGPSGTHPLSSVRRFPIRMCATFTHGL